MFKNYNEFFEIGSSKNNFINHFKSYLNNQSCDKDVLYDFSSSYIYFPKSTRNIDSKNNVLLITHELSRTGAPIVALDTAKVLVEQGYFVTIITPKDGIILSDFIEIGVPVIVMQQMKLTQYLFSDSDLIINNLDLDCFVNSFDVSIFVTATLYNFVKRYFNTENKILWWIHEGSESYNILGCRMPKTITSNIKVICGGQYSADQLFRYGFNYYPQVLNYGVFDTGLKKVKNENDKVKFLLAGTIGTRKGQLILLEAIKLLPKDIINKSEFTFIGDPYDNDLTGKYIEYLLNEYSLQHKNVNVYKSMSRDKLYNEYIKTDVLVVASTDDPMPVVATESLMLGNICLCSDSTGTSYYIENKKSGFVFKSGDVEDLAEKIEYIVKHKSDLYKIKENGRLIYEHNFDMNIFSNKITNLVKGSIQ